MTKNKIIKKLWGIIDDIDSYGDLAKDDDKMFRNLTEKKQRTRFDLPITTDGYNLTITFSAEYNPAIDDLKELLAIQEKMLTDDYMVGLYNGMEIALATIEKREPKYKDKK